jgi:predicted nucleic acid-binding protein
VIAYFDTSALIPLLITEDGSSRARHLWEAADRVVSARLIYPEARAALAQARRLDRLTGRQLRSAVRELDDRYEQLDLVDLDDTLARRGGELAEAHGLRGYDAVHLAAAERLRDPDLVLVAGDGALLGAAAATGLATAAL